MAQHKATRRLTVAALIAALYTALGLLLPVASFGTVQLRPAEVLTVLPVLTPAAVAGLPIGCFLVNLIGLSTGASALGAWDLLLGPVATLAAALLTRALRHRRVRTLPLVATLPPVLLNAVAVGAQWQWALFPDTPSLFWACAAGVAVGQALACVGGGLVLFSAVNRHAGLKRLLCE